MHTYVLGTKQIGPLITKLELPQVVPNVKQAMVWVAESWDVMKASTVQNCWRKSGIIPQDWAAVGNNQVPAGVQSSELQSLIDELPLGSDALDAEAYENFPRENEVILEVRNLPSCCRFLSPLRFGL